MKIKRIHDISWSLNTDTVVYPGNPEVNFEILKSASTDSQITKITIGSHTGTHLDAPLHVKPGGAGVGVYELESFLGEARVLDCTHETRAVTKQTLLEKGVKKDEIILLKTKNSAHLREPFFNDFIFLSPEGAEYLASISVKLVAIDYLSIKEKGSVDNRPHTELLNKHIPIIEGVDLSQVSEGIYFIVALPLKFNSLDGAPLRAALLEF